MALPFEMSCSMGGLNSIYSRFNFIAVSDCGTSFKSHIYYSIPSALFYSYKNLFIRAMRLRLAKILS